MNTGFDQILFGGEVVESATETPTPTHDVFLSNLLPSDAMDADDSSSMLMLYAEQHSVSGVFDNVMSLEMCAPPSMDAGIKSEWVNEDHFLWQQQQQQQQHRQQQQQSIHQTSAGFNSDDDSGLDHSPASSPSHSSSSSSSSGSDSEGSMAAPSPVPSVAAPASEYGDEDEMPARVISYANVRTFSDLSDEQIANIDFKELTRLMAEAGLSDEQVAEAKARRRRLKNRHSARVCSNKKREKCTELTVTNKTLQKRLTSLKSDNQSLRAENAALKQQNHQLTKAYSDNASEVAQLRHQVSTLSQMLVNAGLLPCIDDAAALAA